MGLVYLLHFERPISDRHTCQHYIGWCLDLVRRLAMHRAGQGARLTQVAVQREIGFEVVRTWPGSRELERLLKDRKDAPHLCPVCCEQRHRKVRQVAVPDLEQLTLGLDEPVEPWPEGFEFPPPPVASISWADISAQRRAAALREPLPIDVPDEIW